MMTHARGWGWESGDSHYVTALCDSVCECQAPPELSV